MTHQRALCVSLMILVLLSTLAESAVFRRRRDVVEQYGLNLESNRPQTHPHHRTRRHQQNARLAGGRHPR
ncbi:hypothetical protein AAVH_31783, partial [Aphelenchoides avenae]